MDHGTAERRTPRIVHDLLPIARTGAKLFAPLLPHIGFDCNGGKRRQELAPGFSTCSRRFPVVTSERNGVRGYPAGESLTPARSHSLR